MEKGFPRQLAAAFEAAIHNGNLLNGTFCVPDIAAVKTVEDVYAEFEKAVSYLFDICMKAYEADALFCKTHNPCPLISILTKDCITKHKDEISGARYHNVTVGCMGMINVADGLCAIDQLVFCQQKYTLAEIIQAVQNKHD